MFNSTLNEREQYWLSMFDELIMDNLSDASLDNTRLAFELGISDRKLYRQVKALTSLTPHLYIRRLKLETSLKLLQSGEYNTVKEVAGKVGFIKTEYFSQLFKEEFGKTPVAVLVKRN